VREHLQSPLPPHRSVQSRCTKCLDARRRPNSRSHSRAARRHSSLGALVSGQHAAANSHDGNTIPSRLDSNVEPLRSRREPIDTPLSCSSICRDKAARAIDSLGCDVSAPKSPQLRSPSSFIENVKINENVSLGC